MAGPDGIIGLFSFGLSPEPRSSEPPAGALYTKDRRDHRQAAGATMSLSLSRDRSLEGHPLSLSGSEVRGRMGGSG
jgi:hypothetical protein